MLLWPPSPIFNVGRKGTILFGAKSNIDKGDRGYLKSDATFPTLLSRIVGQDKPRLELQQVAKIVETFHLLGALLIYLLSLTLQPPSPPYQCC